MAFTSHNDTGSGKVTQVLQSGDASGFCPMGTEGNLSVPQIHLEKKLFSFTKASSNINLHSGFSLHDVGDGYYLTDLI